jgi:hypothetical protein
MRDATLAGLLVLCVAGTANADYVFQWSGNGHWYKPVLVGGSGISWDDARIASEEIGGYLATISSAEENLFVYDLVSDDAYWNRPAGHLHGTGPWLGGTDFGTEGTWRWMTDETWSYSNWGTGEPNNHFPGEHYLHYWAYNSLKAPTWNDQFNVPGTPVLGYVVEFNSNPVPEPSTLLAWSSLIMMGVVFIWRKGRRV